MPENSAPRSNLITVAVLVIALAAVFFVGKSFGDDDTGSAPGTNTTETFGVVTGGQASIGGTPDQLTFTASVHNTRPTTTAAMEGTNHDVTAVVIAAKQNGVEAKDIQTKGISIQPSYDYSGPTRRLVGYSSTQSVKIKVRKLGNAGKTIGAVVTAAGNAVDIAGISLSISNRDELVAKARASAVKKSKAAAVALAQAAGREVGKLEYVEEVVPQRTFYNDGDVAALNAFSVKRLPSPSVPINPGRQTVSVTVKVRWSLAQ